MNPQTQAQLGFSYCPYCGQQQDSPDQRRFVCQSCGYVLYFNMASAVAGLIFRDEKLLLTVRGQEPRKGLLDLPGGFVEFWEPAEEALAREIREELNLEITEASFFCSQPNDYTYGKVTYMVLDIYFCCRATNFSDICPGDDVADYVLMRPEEIKPDELAFISTRQAIKRLVATSVS